MILHDEYRMVEHCRFYPHALTSHPGFVGCSELSAQASGLNSMVDTLVKCEKRSQAILAVLLGKAYTLSDVLYYGVGAACGFAMSTVPAMRAARMPIFADCGGRLSGGTGCLCALVGACGY